MKKSFIYSGIISGLIVGLLDGTAACVNAYLARAVAPEGVFRYVASGVFGKEAFTGAGQIPLYGLLFHFTIALGWTMLFFFLFDKVNFLRADKMVVGLCYGIFIWLMMNGVVLPLSNVQPPVYRVIPTLIMIGIHMVVIGLTISILANRFLKKN